MGQPLPKCTKIRYDKENAQLTKGSFAMKPIYQVYGNDAHAMTMQLMEAAHIADLIPSKNASIALKRHPA